jgi:putative ABC transport system substrate-binding protein
MPDAVPNAHRIAVLWNPANAVYQKAMLEATKAAGQALNVELQVLAATKPEEIDKAFEAMNKEHVEALNILADPLLAVEQKHLISLVTAARLPSVTATRGYADEGGLMSYGPNYGAVSRRTAFFVARILGGTPPADLPVEQATIFEFVINQRAANALDLTIPLALLQRADDVLE